MGEELQYDDEGHVGKWVYSHKSNSPIFVREGETPQEAFLRREYKAKELEKLYQIRKNQEAANDQTHVYTDQEARYKRISQALYREAYELGFRLPKDRINFDDPEEVVRYSNSLIKNCPNNGSSSNSEPACFRSAGAIAALFDKSGITDYRCFIGVASTSSSLSAAEDSIESNHMWIEWNGKVFETFPLVNVKDITYRQPHVEIFFYL